MSMLADPRRKQKISVDPRNLQWKNDQNKFGQKLMEKMGWTSGKGLGLNEKGSVDPIKVTLKTDNRGVGCSRNYADNWIAHQDDFNSLLANLNTQNADEGPASDPEAGRVQSLEKKSKSSKGRLHYMKFAKGKDLSCKTSQDLDCVFGRRKSKSAPSTPNNVSEANSEEENEETKDDYPEKSDVNTFNSGTSVQDYFAAKMAALKKLRNSPSLQTINNNSEDLEDSRRGFGFSDTSDSQSRTGFGFVPATQEIDVSSDTKMTSDSVQGMPEPEEDSNSSNECKKKKKKKKKRKADDLEEVVLDEKPEVEVAVESDGESAKKKKKKSKKKKEDKATVEEDAPEIVENIEESESKNKKKKRKKKEEEESNETQPSKKVKREEDCEETSSQNVPEKESENKEEDGSVEKKKSKKKKKKERESEQVALEECEANAASEDCSEVTKSEKKKKKKKKEKSGSESPSLSEEDDKTEGGDKKLTKEEKRRLYFEERKKAAKLLEGLESLSQSLPLHQSSNKHNTLEWGDTNNINRRLNISGDYGFKGSNVAEVKGYGHEFGIEKTVRSLQTNKMKEIQRLNNLES